MKHAEAAAAVKEAAAAAIALEAAAAVAASAPAAGEGQEGDGRLSQDPMTKLPILDFKGLLVAINPAQVLKIEERESKDGTPRCIIHFVDQSMLTWDGKLSALLPLLL